LSRLQAGEGQILFDGPTAEFRNAADPRVRQFVAGEARERLRET
jgi:phospholipid/cholesterol/gamma-HCH transport system ATP-binding protein